MAWMDGNDLDGAQNPVVEARLSGGRKEALLVTLVTHPANPNVNERVLRMHCWELQAYSSESLISCFFLNSTSHADGLATTSVPCFIRACSLPVSISPSILKSLINDQNG